MEIVTSTLLFSPHQVYVVSDYVVKYLYYPIYYCYGTNIYFLSESALQAFQGMNIFDKWRNSNELRSNQSLALSFAYCASSTSSRVSVSLFNGKYIFVPYK